MEKIKEYLTVESRSESENANNPQDDTHDNLLLVQSHDETDSTRVVESPTFFRAAWTFLLKTAIMSIKKKSRKFQQSRKGKHEWILHDCEKTKVFCSTCIKTTHMKMSLPHHSREGWKDFYETFILNGFSNWKKALQIFVYQERSELHRALISMIASATLRSTVI